MDILKNNIKVPKTARFYASGSMNSDVSELVYVLHGYGMQAPSFIEKFDVLSSPGRLIVAPEGMSRFYRKGFSGDVVASWMTSDDREMEIEDYVSYLNLLHEHLLNMHPSKKIMKVTVVGFSQGASTASRWINSRYVKPDRFIIWCGEMAPEVISSFPALPVTFISASEDVFISKEKSDGHADQMLNGGVELTRIRFEGGHDIDKQLLATLF